MRVRDVVNTTAMLDVHWVELGQSIPGHMVVASLMYACLTWNALSVALLALIAANAVMVPLVKSILRQRRPARVDPRKCGAHGMGMTAGVTVWGMPSGHTQLATSVCLFLALAVWARLQDEAKSWRKGLFMWVTLPVLAAIPLLVAWQRTYVRCHSKAQIAVGGVVGAVLAILAWTLVADRV